MGKCITAKRKSADNTPLPVSEELRNSSSNQLTMLGGLTGSDYCYRLGGLRGQNALYIKQKGIVFRGRQQQRVLVIQCGDNASTSFSGGITLSFSKLLRHAPSVRYSKRPGNRRQLL